MEGGDPWSMLKCAGGARDKTIINRIMHRFRPIAPKPVNGDSVPGDSMSSNKNWVVIGKRTKRRYVRVCKKNNMKRRRIMGEAKEDNDENNKGSATTLQLMPEKADLEKSMDVGLDLTVGDNYRLQDPPSLCLKLKKMVEAADDMWMMGLSDQTVALATSTGRRSRMATVVESWVTAESVTDACMDEGEMGNCTDVEKIRNLEKDTCPGFVTDGLNRVLWVNQAYKKMVGSVNNGGEEGVETTIRLAVKDDFIFPYGAFSCRVRLQYGGDGKGKKHSKTVPCDVWKMRSGGFAWRLDVKAALSLGL
ncbi:hypothetical protein PTKIN_Ptkin07bG0015900 [Pterospermum kingtungense]